MRPTVMEDLIPGERLLLRTLRQIAFGQGGCRLLPAAFQQACGCAGAQALTALEAFVLGLALHSRRKVELHYPTFGSLSDDEQRLLEAFGFAQAEAYGRLQARMGEILQDEPDFTMLSAAVLVAQALEFEGFSIRTASEAHGTGRSQGPSTAAVDLEAPAPAPEGWRLPAIATDLHCH